MSLAVIGDVHGQTYAYRELIKQFEYSVQVGDMGYRYENLDDVDESRHVFIMGNHDNYMDKKHKNILKWSRSINYGNASLGGIDFFFMRGERSIDYMFRTPYYDYFPDEELTEKEFERCLALYTKSKPSVVITHGCPKSVISKVSSFEYYNGEKLKPSITSLYLEELLKVHRPNIWVFGHYHKNVLFESKRTVFRCVAPMDYVVLDENSYEQMRSQASTFKAWQKKLATKT